MSWHIGQREDISREEAQNFRLREGVTFFHNSEGEATRETFCGFKLGIWTNKKHIFQNMGQIQVKS